MSKFFKKLISIVAATVLTVICVSATTSNEVVIEAITGQKISQYNIDLNAPFTKENCGINEVVNPETGSFTYNISLFDLNARGLEEILKLSFNPQNAKTNQESFSYDSTSNTYSNEVDDFSNVELANECFAVGWKFDLPYVEINRSAIYVHMPDGSVYLYDSSSKSGLKGYPLEDKEFLALESDGYTLSLVDGIEYTFDPNGFLENKSDRFGNYINYIWDKTSQPHRLLSIESCTGEKVSISYTQKSVNVSNGNRTFVIERENINSTSFVPFLTSITDPQNRITRFEYDEHSLKYTLSKGIEPANINYYTISQITYDTGTKTFYDYQVYQKGSGTGYLSYLKLTSRYDISPLGEISNKQSYTYIGEPDGYPLHTSGTLPDSYTYQTIVTNQEGSSEIFVYSYTHEPISKKTLVNDKIQSEIIYRYDEKRMPLNTVTEFYGNDNKKRSVYTDTKYDDKGQLIATDTYDYYTGPGKYIVEYEYSDKYGICIYQKQNIDDSKTVEIRRTLCDDGKNINSIQILKNGTLEKSVFYKYDVYGNLISSKEQIDDISYKLEEYVFSEKTSFAYPDKYILKGVLDADGKETTVTVSYEYDDYGNIVCSTDGCNNKTLYEYDKLGNIIKETLPSGKSRFYNYKYKENTIVATDALGNTITYLYDGFGRLSSVKDNAGNNLTQKTYNSLGLLESETDAIGTKFVYGYDEFNRVASLEAIDKNDNILSYTKYDYDEAYYIDSSAFSYFSTSITGSAGEIKTSYLFDFLGRQTIEESYGQDSIRVTRYEYDYLGNNTKVYLPDNSVQSNIFDVFGNVIASKYGNITEKYSYDLLGNNISYTNGEGETYKTFYNTLGLPIITQTPFDNKTFVISKVYYDACGRVIEQIDGEENSVKYEYDSNGNVIKVSMSDSVTTYEYDAENRMIAMHTGTENNTKTQRYEYDHLGNLTKSTDEMGFSEYYTYDLNGNILTYVDKNGVCVYNIYDGLNRVTCTKNSKDNTEFKYTYDSAGQLISVNGTSYKYNRFGELVEQTENGHTQRYSYNALGNRQSYGLYNGNIREMQINYNYDIQGRLSNISSPLGNQNYTYDNANRLLKASNTASKMSSEYSYYPSGNIKSVAQINGLEVVDRVEYEYNKNGFRTSELGIKTEKHYVYDDQNRISREYDHNLITTYSYDDFGNIKSVENALNGYSTKVVYSYDKNNRLVAQTKNGITAEYKYDNQGNLVFDGEKVYRYNGFNKLTNISGNNLDAVYTYDHTGLRTSKTVNGVYTSLVSDGQNVVAQYADGRASYYYRGLQLIGYTNSNNDINFYQFNAHGDVTSIYDGFGNQIRSYDYDAFGKQKDSHDDIYRDVADDNPFRYCGEYFDTETNLIYLRARYYNPEIQRFVAEDTHWTPFNAIYGDKPYILQGVAVPNIYSIKQHCNSYLYSGNNPVYFKDTNGEFFDIIWDVASLIFSIADVISDPTDGWAWAGLAGDVVDLIPGVTGLGETIKATNGLVFVGSKADDIVDSLKGLKAVERASKIKDGAVVLSYSNLRKLSKGTGLEAHHLIEKRFATALGIKNTDDILSIAIDNDTHQAITNSFRKKIGYTGDKLADITTLAAGPQEIWNAIYKTYKENGMADLLPELKKYLIENSSEVDKITDWLGVK